MSDRFRFRVWSFQQKRMYYWNEIINMTNSCYSLFVDNRELGEGLWDIQQSTGLKDINEAIIYEGDIVRLSYFDYNGKDYCMVGVIKYEMFGLMIKGVKGEHFEDFTGYEECEGKMYLTCWLGEFDFDPDNDIEVIGNIHEMEKENE